MWICIFMRVYTYTQIDTCIDVFTWLNDGEKTETFLMHYK